MMRFSQILMAPIIALIYLYRYSISPFLGPRCRFEPSCSAYAEEALRHHGLWRGLKLTLYRLGRCHPWGGSGVDPVPPAHSTSSLHSAP